MPRQVERLLAQGAYAFLTKPLDVYKFLTLLGSLLAEVAHKTMLEELLDHLGCTQPPQHHRSTPDATALSVAPA